MLENLVPALLLLLDNAWLVPIGVLAGFWIGATPGLGASSAIAVLLPVLIGLPPEVGLLLGISIYAGSEVGNSYPAILINIPGTASSAVTTLDGHSMAKQGQASRALGISIMASTLGGLIGGLITVLSAPFLAKIALMFGPAEICIMVLFGIAIIAQIAAGGILKGLLAGLFGLFLATVGTDPIFGQTRGTFGVPYLIDGIGVVPVLVGLLGFSELISIIERGIHHTNPRQVNIGMQGLWQGMRDVLNRPISTIRGGLIGLIVGIVPGAGGSVSAFIAYNQEMSSAKPERRKRFGSGAPEGVLAPDVANNACVSGALVPLLTLGIPGSGTTAVMLVLMSAQGLATGPNLFNYNGDVAYMVLLGQFVTIPFLFLIGVPCALLAYRVMNVPVSILTPLIAVFCFIGAFGYREYISDLWIMLVFGFLGWLMKRYRYPTISLVLGLVLGRLFEANLFQAIRIGFGTPDEFYHSPLPILLWILLISTLFGPWALQRLRGRTSLGPPH